MKEPRDSASTNQQQAQPVNAQNGSHPSGLAVANKTQVNAPQSEESSNKMVRSEAFDQPVILKQTARWSHAIIISIISVTIISVILSLFKIEEAVQATGKLEPQGAVQEVDAPVNGVVEEVLVRDGDSVRAGELLVRLDPEATETDLERLRQGIDSLDKENQFLRAHLSGLPIEQIPSALGLDLPPELLLQVSNRLAFIEENQLYRAALSNAGPSSLSPEQQFRLGALQTEAQSDVSSALFEVEALQRQLAQVEGQIAFAEQNLAIEQDILDNITPLVEEGALSSLQLNRQRSEVLTRQDEYNRLRDERQVISSRISQAQQNLTNRRSTNSNDLLTPMSENDKRIAEIDSTL
ncbi:MAG: biotin/lipoyl-binding protein, partial [Cyanobacteria bacterium J06626_14]